MQILGINNKKCNKSKSCVKILPCANRCTHRQNRRILFCTALLQILHCFLCKKQKTIYCFNFTCQNTICSSKIIKLTKYNYNQFLYTRKKEG